MTGNDSGKLKKGKAGERLGGKRQKKQKYRRKRNKIDTDACHNWKLQKVGEKVLRSQGKKRRLRKGGASRGLESVK